MESVTIEQTSGLDLQWVDPTTRAADDLFIHVNGKWLDSHQIPDDRSIDGAFHVLRDNAEADVRAIVEECADAEHPENEAAAKIGDLYASFMDVDRIESLGIEPIADQLREIAAVADTAGLVTLLGRMQRDGVGGLFGVYVDTDARQSDRYLVHLVQSGLGLPDESYYRDENHAAVREAYRTHIAAMLALTGADDAQAQAAAIFELETAIASHHWDVVRRRDAEATYNLLTLAELTDLAAGYDVAAWLDGIGTEAAFAEVNVGQPSFVEGAAALLTSQPLDAWKSWLSWRLLRTVATYLPAAFVDENFAFYGKTLTGAEVIRDRWKRGVGFVEQAAGFAVGEVYVQRHFPPEAKARMDELIANLVEAYRRNINELPWMTPATREKALVKLNKFTPKIGYPATWIDYSTLEVDRTDLIGNARRAAAFETARDLEKIGKPVDRDEWFMTPQTVNAYYNPGMNEIVFPAAILQPPFFDPDADDAANYGGIGAVIGHEIGHGFDDQGAKYDGDGNLVDWWTDDDRAEFGKRTSALSAQYAQFTPNGLDEKYKVNGEFTLGENIGDLGGLSIALVAYGVALEKSGTGESSGAPIIDDLTGIQRVFFNWAQIWRTKTRDEEAIRRLSIDPHSPPEFRCNGVVRNVDAFYDAFDVVPGDALYLPPEERVRIW